METIGLKSNIGGIVFGIHNRRGLCSSSFSVWQNIHTAPEPFLIPKLPTNRSPIIHICACTCAISCSMGKPSWLRSVKDNPDSATAWGKWLEWITDNCVGLIPTKEIFLISSPNFPILKASLFSSERCDPARSRVHRIKAGDPGSFFHSGKVLAMLMSVSVADVQQRSMYTSDGLESCFIKCSLAARAHLSLLKLFLRNCSGRTSGTIW